MFKAFFYSEPSIHVQSLLLFLGTLKFENGMVHLKTDSLPISSVMYKQIP